MSGACARSPPDELPGIPVSLSSDVVPEMQEYERTVTTVANSYVRPRVSRYVANLKAKIEMAAKDVKLHILRSDGGLAGAEGAEEYPVNLLMSGPAGGVTGALWVAVQAGFPHLLTVDVGGTSTDVALIQNGEPRLRRETTVGDVTVRASSVDIRTVGAGGGSIAHVPELTRALRVGPQSRRRRPGPAAYGRGGTEPTVTDANVVLGYLPEMQKLGGDMTLEPRTRRPRPCRRSPTALEAVAQGRGARHLQHRQREHGRRAAPGVGGTGLRSARLCADRLRRRGPAACQRAVAAARLLAVHHSAGTRRAVRPRRRHHRGARRARTHLRQEVLGHQCGRARRDPEEAGGGGRPIPRARRRAARRDHHQLPGGSALSRPGPAAHRQHSTRRAGEEGPDAPSPTSSTPSTSGCSHLRCSSSTSS